jgi:phospholipase D1/2
VILVVPIHPEGSLETGTVRYIVGWFLKTIFWADNSMFQVFSKAFPELDFSEYMSVYALRNWGSLGDQLVTDQIYVHAKLMIIDDRVVSSNPDSRSGFQIS